jgi:hypothetical protein
MTTLWLAIFVYSVGLGLVLHFRPSLMFQANGAWKEFGYKRAPESRYTIFPVWLFAIVWAILSYAIAAAFTTLWFTPAATMAAVSSSYMNTNMSEVAGPFGSPSGMEMDMEVEEPPVSMMRASNFASPEEDEQENETETMEMTDEFVLPTRRPRGRPRKQPRPGYYVLDPASREGGLHQYIYYGPEAPGPNAGPTTRV